MNFEWTSIPTMIRFVMTALLGFILVFSAAGCSKKGNLEGPKPPAAKPSGLSQEVKRQVLPCWSIPVGAKNTQVHVLIYLNPDGTLRGEPRVVDSKRMRRDRAFRAVAESALRALRDPRCSPLKLPVKSYKIWRQIYFNFNTRPID